MPNKPSFTEYPYTFKIYIPTECICGELLPEMERNEVLDDVKGTLSGWFGGATTSRVEGSWEHTDGRLAKEPVDVLTSYATEDAAKEHHEEFTELVADLANRLTQAGVLCEMNDKGIVYDATALPKPHRCMGGGALGALPVGRQASEKQRQFQLEAALQQLTGVRDTRDLFCRVLHYDYADEQLATVQWPDKLKEYLAPGAAPRIIADQNGFKILYLQLAEKYLRKGHERLLVQRIIKDDPTLRGLVVVSDVDQKDWHLVNAKFEKEEGKNERLRLRRMRVGPKQSVRTAVERLSMVDIEAAGEDTSAAELQDLHDRAFDVESVSKEFFNEISNWYFWALSEVEFPTDTLTGDDDEKHRATSLIRFLTRMIFCWFLKEKDLIPPDLFREKDLASILTDLDPDSCSYHQGILQNLFFATLNQRMGKDNKGNPCRAFARDEGFLKNRSTYGVDTLYRYEEHFQDPDKALSHFAEVPFLNGGLFECLDRADEDTGKKLYVDGFSRNKKKRARVPNELFFSGEQTVDLSAAYGDTGRRNARVRGLLNILHAYNFTVEENTPIDEEIALDPELLGKVFENLLASYNEETKTTARKQTGSFYTPRPIVEYMVDESLKAHLTGTLTKLGGKEEKAGEQLDLLLGYTDEDPPFSEEEIDALLEAINTCKILDPACGSGAFPIGMLQKLVHIVHKLDPENARWKELQIKSAEAIPDPTAKAAAIKAIEKDFEENGDDYGRKLYLIENCLYGVDIQPIAIQISKLRFFISLICDQKTNRDKAKNHGIRALPNLETKFVAADTLIGLPEMDQMALVDPRVNQIEAEIESLYHRHFSIQRRDQKLAIQKKLRELRKDLGQVLAESLGSSRKAEHLAEWNPFDSQASSNFFDPHWMFGQSLADGFDIVIGNPPYISVEKFRNTESRDKWAATYNTYATRGDIYCLFYEQGLRLLKAGGVLTYITSNKFQRAAYGRTLRELLASLNILKLVDFCELPVFEAGTDPIIVIVRNQRAHPRFTFPVLVVKDERELSQIAFSVASKASLYLNAQLSTEGWSLEGSDAIMLVEKLKLNGKPLSDHVGNRLSLGIRTGLNDAFVIDRATRDRLIREDPTSARLIKPWIRGRDVNRWTHTFAELYVIIVPFGFHDQLSQYPAILSHLEIFENKLKARGQCRTSRSGAKMGQHHWLELDNNPSENYIASFETPKIVIADIGKHLKAAWAGPEYFIGNTGYIISSADHFTLAVLLSSAVDWFARMSFQGLGDPWSGGRMRFINRNLVTIPVPNANETDKDRLSSLAEDAVRVADAGEFAKLNEIEREIDSLIYKAFGLDQSEISQIESALAGSCSYRES